MTRILHLVEAYGGGVETALQSYVRSLPDAEHVLLGRSRQVHATGCDLALWERVELLDIPLLALYGALVRRIRAWAPDVVHAHSSYAGALARLLPPGSPPVVYSPHCFAVERQDLCRVARVAVHAAERALGRRPCTVAALSPHEAGLARALSPGSTVHLVPNTAPAVTVEKRWNGRAPLQIVTVGRVSAQKDPAFCAEVARLLPAGVAWTWIGNGDPAGERELRNAGVCVTGWLDHHAAQSLMAQADLMVHTAAWEGSPMTLLEGLSLGLAVIVRGLPALDSLEYFSGGPTPEQTAQAVRRFLTDPQARVEVYSAGDAVLEAATRAHQRRGLERCYAIALGRDPVRAGAVLPVPRAAADDAVRSAVIATATPGGRVSPRR